MSREIDEILDSITACDFKQVLSYYGLRIVKNSILCPFHNDKHYGSCVINKSGKSAKCYSCGKNFTSFNLAMHYEGLEFADAVRFVWHNILGHPAFDEEEECSFQIGYKVLREIGLAPQQETARRIMYQNMVPKRSTLPSGWEADWNRKDDLGYVPAGPVIRQIAVYDLYKDNPAAAVFLVKNKIMETMHVYYSHYKELHDPDTTLGAFYLECPDDAEKICRSILQHIRSLQKTLRYICHLSTESS